jgi:outer membrane protein OmpA-like peptidoglycan-associated protein
MNRKHAALFIAPILAILAGCAGERVPPKALTDARADYFRAKDGLATRLDPTDLHEADVALQQAERAFDKSPDEPITVDLAIIADRKALLAEANAGTIQAQSDSQRATATLETTRNEQLRTARGQLNQSQQALGLTQMQLQEQQTAAAAQQAHMHDLEEKLKDARMTIAKIASVKDDDRGMVITLSGEVLFTTGKSDLKPAAMAKLDQIAQALQGKEQPIVVYGFTDNVGTRDHNMGLSQSRAQAVRDYLVSKGIPKDLIESRGSGPDSPVADNTSIEGRAQNRRVEIVVEPKK